MAQTLSGTIIGNGNIYSSPTTKLDEALSTTSTNAVQNKVITTELNKKQNILTFDATPKNGSTNPVTSGGIKTAMDALSEKIASSVSSDDFFIKDIDNDIVLANNPTTSKLFVVDSSSDIVMQN